VRAGGLRGVPQQLLTGQLALNILRPCRLLYALAWLNVVVHVAGLILAATGIQPGSPLVPLPDRLVYLAGAPLGWTSAWITWMLCAVALIAFLAKLVSRLGPQAGLAQLGLMIAVAGAAFDLCCDAVYLLVFPWLAAMTPIHEVLFLTVERITNIASIVIANGAYSLSILLLTLELRRGVATLTTTTGFGVAGFGLLLAAAGFSGNPEHIRWATPPTIGLFCLWAILVARSFERAEHFNPSGGRCG